MPRTITLRCGSCGSPLTFTVETWANTPERAYCDESCRRRTPEHAHPDAATA